MAKVLLVDDDENVRYAINKLLTKNGHDVDLAENGEVALRKISAETQVLISDIIMPEIEGIELFHTVRKLWPSLPIVIISGGGRVNAEEYLNDFRFMRADATFQKPLDEPAFLSAVAELAERNFETS